MTKRKPYSHQPWYWIAALVVVLGWVPASGQTARAMAVAPAATNTLSVQVISARTEPDHPGGPVSQGDSISQYKFIINVDNTGDPIQPRYPDCYPYLDPPNNTVVNTAYPDSCDWPSIRAVPGSAPIFTQGTQDDIAAGIDLPDGKYLISVLADGYKIGGQHFTMPLADASPVVVALQPHPLPTASVQIKVFEDISPTNGAFDDPAEHGLSGFKANVNEILGLVSTDVFGNPLCTQYDAGGNVLPTPPGQPGDWCLYSDANGDIVVPNLGPNRYDIDIIPPAGSNWVQTTTLEGSTGWDTWVAEGNTGLDNEFVTAGEPFPWTVAGFVSPTDSLNDGGVSGAITGRIVSAAVYVPQNGGLPYYGGQWGGLNGAKITGPISNAWVALADLQNGDTAVYVAPANADGTFTISNVPDGNYFLTYWDYELHYIMDWMTVTVLNGQVTDLGTPFLTGWFTWVKGYVFIDSNGNGFRDPGEMGVSDYLVTLKERENTEMDRMTSAVTTDSNGYYFFDRAYPLGSWTILEAYNDRYYTTGISYKVENQPDWTTVLGSGVDVGMLPILGQTGQLDWGVRPYDTTGVTGPKNGGIVGTVSYDTTRNELDPRYAAVEPWQPGVPGLTMNLWKPIACGTNPGTACDDSGKYELAPDGSIAKSQLLNQTVTETWEQPVDCQPRDVNGNPVSQLVFPPSSGGYRCLEAPMTGLQFQSGFATLDGNYGFGDGCFGLGGFDPGTQACADGNGPIPLPAGDYLVETVIPNDSFGKPLYGVTREEDINIFNGDQFVPQIPPPSCAGPLHTVDVAGVGTDGYPASNPKPGVTVPASTPTDNPTFADGGGSPFEGMAKPLCDTKLVNLGTGRSVAPTYNLFTDVPIPGRWKGYIIDDLTISVDPKQLNFGEKAGIANSPIGIYDFTNRLQTTITSDPNGVYEVLLPSTYSINCPSPSGVCPNIYYLLGNDPGQPGHPNANYNPQYRSIGASFEIWPGRFEPSDLAPTQIAASILSPSSGLTAPAQCTLASDTPQFFAVSQPYVNGSGSITIQGQGFGASAGTNGKVTLDGVPLPVTSWNDGQIDVDVPSGTPEGPHQLLITADNGQTTVNGLTFHVLGGAYTPQLYEVGAGRTYSLIKDALEAAAADKSSNPGHDELVIVYPDSPALWNPTGTHFENIVIHSPVKLQGVGPGGVRADSSAVLGSVVNGGGVLGDTQAAQDWRTLVGSLTWDGNQTIYDGPVVTLLVHDGDFQSGFKPAIDGLTIEGGDQQGFPGFLPGAEPGAQNIVTIQGGGIYANAYARYLQITNNVLRSNGGAYGGAIRLGTPNLQGAANDNQNDFVNIAHNRILANGGTNLAGAIGIFSGAADYTVAYNDICGNFSAEYGGGISHYGFSPNGQIHHNRVYFNRSYDEAGGIMIAGELSVDPAVLTMGAGPVDVYANLIQANLGNDDGGGLRFLNAGNFPYNVYNNIVVNNISTHEGAGISISDAPDVRVFNNTVMRNTTTATAQTSNGFPAPSGLSSSRNSDLLQATLPPGSPIFSNPVLFNNIFWNNRAGSFSGGGVSGIGLAGDPSPINYWDVGVADGSGLPSPVYSILQTTNGTVSSPSNQVGADPQVIATYDTSVSILPWRGNPNFVDTTIVAVDQPVTLLGDYHVQSISTAIDAGTASQGSVNAPGQDFSGFLRPQGAGYDIGADEAQDALVPQAPVVTISRSGPDVVLNWPAVTLDIGGNPTTVTGYEVHRSTSAYFTPDATTLLGTVGTPGFTDPNVIGPVVSNFYYLVKAVGSLGNSDSSNRVGKYDYELRETTGTDYNWIGLPLDAGLAMASNLRTYIQSNATPALTVGSIQRWNAVGQNYQTFNTVPAPSGDFALTLGGVYRITVNITGVNSGAAILTLLGNVPPASTFSYNLAETTGTDFNWIMLPLDKGAISNASGLKINMDGTMHPAAAIKAVAGWNPVAQNYQTYNTVPIPSGDFAIATGQPYRVTVDVVTGTSTIWP